MNIYRLYVLDDADRIGDAIEEDFADDASALAQAQAVLKDEYAVEVWTGGRLVARLGGEFNVVLSDATSGGSAASSAEAR